MGAVVVAAPPASGASPAGTKRCPVRAVRDAGPGRVLGLYVYGRTRRPALAFDLRGFGPAYEFLAFPAEDRVQRGGHERRPGPGVDERPTADRNVCKRPIKRS